jgi:predicted transcriptional regulator of viral defense system
MKRGLGKLETQFFAWVQLRKRATVQAGDVASALRITRKQEDELLSRLTRAGLIARVKKGLYLVPDRLPLGGKWSPGEALALSTLIEDAGGRYQVCGPNAFNRYGFADQIPTVTYAYNNRYSGRRRIGSVALSLIKVSDRRLGATDSVKTSDVPSLVYSSRLRTLIDAVYDWSRFNGLPRAYGWIREEIVKDARVAGKLVQLVLDYGNQGTVRRIGYLLEREGVRAAVVGKLRDALNPSSALIPWDPTRPRRGKTVRTWGVLDNAE